MICEAIIDKHAKNQLNILTFLCNVPDLSDFDTNDSRMYKKWNINSSIVDINYLD